MTLNDSITTEYQIFIGCSDAYNKKTLVSEEELRNIVNDFFSKKHIDFSMVSLKGGFLHADSNFIIEDTLCINIITNNENDIKALTKDLSMFMNQESALIVKYNISANFR